ncbi:enhanced intracellular survival protein Eis [Nonomuraea mangrovi]|uniref:Enhanced intracellular survival protein Eis n=1 Tax=Nonomuraea mangrovi TaxID=2316207 RepID=A0ABW4SQR1_9ACTN
MDIRDLTPDDLDAVLDTRKRSFGPVPDDTVDAWRATARATMERGRYLGVFDGSRLAAAGRLPGFTQWWHGRPQPMAGIAGVVVNPEDRGRGVGRRLMRAILARAAELGDAVSALYPATTPIYRSLGWEHAGAENVVTLSPEALRTIRPTEPVKLRRMGPGDAAEVIAIVGRVHAANRASGPICWDEAAWRDFLGDEDDFLYLADDGFVTYTWDDGDIAVDNLVAGSAATARALWSLVGTSSSVATKVTAVVAPDDPVLWLLRERGKEEVKRTRWMFRVVDVADAIARRGFPSVVSANALVTVEDPERPANTGTWRLEISGGSGTAGATEGEGPRFTVNGLSALYAGIPTSTLRLGGLLSGPEEFDEALDAAFAGTPYMLDYF